jgi:hypothetical protein
MENPDPTLELSAEDMRHLVTQAVERIVAHLESLSIQPSVDVEGGIELARSLVEPLPETGQPYLEESSQGVKSVALDCGFGSADTMRRAFLRTLRVAPIGYRSRFRAAAA